MVHVKVKNILEYKGNAKGLSEYFKIMIKYYIYDFLDRHDEERMKT